MNLPLIKLAAMICVVVFCIAAEAEKPKCDIECRDAWARCPAGTSRVGAAFMTITNSAAEADKLVGVTCALAKTVELHASIRDGDVMRMRKVETIDLPAGESVELKPGGYHLMLIDMIEKPREGKTIELKMKFEKAGEQVVRAEVRRN